MDAIPLSGPIPLVSAFDISVRGRIVASSGWHRAESSVNAKALRGDDEGGTSVPQPGWTILLERLGGSSQLANRKAAELKPTIDAANLIITALNDLSERSTFADLERALGLREPRSSHDRIGDAMSRVLRDLEHRRADPRDSLEAR